MLHADDGLFQEFKYQYSIIRLSDAMPRSSLTDSRR